MINPAPSTARRQQAPPAGIRRKCGGFDRIVPSFRDASLRSRAGMTPTRIKRENRCARAFSGKVETGFPSENATNATEREHIQFPQKLNVLSSDERQVRGYGWPSTRPGPEAQLTPRAGGPA